MKIVHALGWYFPDSLGGTEVYVAALSKHLRAQGHEVRIAAPDTRNDRERTYEHGGVEVYRYPIPAAPTRSEAQGRTLVRGAEMLHRWLGQVRPDVFHCHSIVTGLGLDEIEAARALGARVVVTCHTPSLGFLCQRGTMLRYGRELCDGLAIPAKCAACELQHRGVPEPMARLFAVTPLAASRVGTRLPGRLGTALGMPALIAWNIERQRRLLDAADAFVVLTEWARGTVAANNGSDRKLFVNRLGIELDVGRTARGPTEQPLSFGYVGRFDTLKGVLILAEAVSRLPKSLPFTLELRGPSADASSKEVRARVQSLVGDDPRVRFAPATPHDRLDAILAGYDVLLCPSVCLEGGPTVALEARAVGTPVLGSRIGGLAEIVRDEIDGALVPPGDADLLARAMERVALDVAVVDRWRENLPGERTMIDVASTHLTIYGADAE